MDATFLALGDSYTVGEGVAAGDSWPAQVAARLRAGRAGIERARIVARTGWTTDELAAAMDAAKFDPPYPLVTLGVGVNDQYRGRTAVEYRQQFQGVLRRALSLAGGGAGRVVVVSIPDWGVTPFAAREARDPAAVARDIDAFNAVAREAAVRAGARWVDVTAISRAPGLRAALALDGLHPSAAQYARWADAIAPVARAALADA